jgi:hypothetical protein
VLVAVALADHTVPDDDGVIVREPVGETEGTAPGDRDAEGDAEGSTVAELDGVGARPRTSTATVVGPMQLPDTAEGALWAPMKMPVSTFQQPEESSKKAPKRPRR